VGIRPELKLRDEGATEPSPGPGRGLDDLLTAAELASLLRVGRSSVYRLLQAGRIPALRIAPRTVRFDLQEVRAALKGDA
jgi:excisionase family DNA binding protein